MKPAALAAIARAALRAPWGLSMSRLTIGAVLLGALIGTALLAGWLAPQDPIRQDQNFSLFSPSRFHPLGTDRLGRDVMARLVHGARVSLTVGAAAALLAGLLGGAVGLAAGAAGGVLDRALMRLVDVMMAFPTLALLLVLAVLFRSDSAVCLILLLGLTAWMPIARLARARAASLASRRFVEAAAGLGASPLRRAVRHIAPNVLPTLIVGATPLIGELMLMESGLSYLGLGVADPTPSWGEMVRHGMRDLGGGWWVSVFPGLALALSVIGLHLVGDGLRDVLNAGEELAIGTTGPAPGE